MTNDARRHAIRLPATDGPHYPKTETHAWGAFAFLAIEAGGYNDLEAVNPYNGERLNVQVWQREEDANPYTGLRRLIDAMEQAGFLDQPDD